ncbi:MAG: DUF3618 domain-containing protein [Solirubrobacterales bacterium]|nr:DUF3618 domain-containing protein [Solirubrobacterales bacterium]
MSASSEQAEIQEQIEQTREQLGDTVDALAAKADVGARAGEKLQDAKAQTDAKAAEVKQTLSEKREKIRAATPDSAQAAAQVASDNPVPVAIAGGALLVGFLVGRASAR